METILNLMFSVIGPMPIICIHIIQVQCMCVHLFFMVKRVNFVRACCGQGWGQLHEIQLQLQLQLLSISQLQLQLL